MRRVFVRGGAIREHGPARANGLARLRRLVGVGAAVPSGPTVEMTRGDAASLLVRLAGAWRLAGDPPHADVVERELDRAGAARVTIDASGVGDWDSALV